MSLSVFSLIMAVLWFDAFILLSSGLRRKTGFLLQYSLWPLISIIIVSLVRVVLPLELPFAFVLRSRQVMPLMKGVWIDKVSLWGGLQVSALWVLLCLCATVSVILLIRLFFRIHRGNMYIQVLYTQEDARAMRILQQIIDQTKPGKECALRIVPDLPSPIITGVFHPIILIPKAATQLSDKQLQYILRHEWNHYVSKDLWVKLLIYILCCVMWWNPVVHLLKKDLDQILELNCDCRVTGGMKEWERLEYLETMMEILKQNCAEENHRMEAGLGVCFVGVNQRADTIQRFQLVCDHKKCIANWKTNLMFTLIMVGLFLFSFSFVFQPYIPVPPVEEGPSNYFMITPETSYLQLEEDGTYSLYVNGQYFGVASADAMQKEPYNLLPITENKTE